MKVLMCDPPSGWKYGFPKPIPEDVEDIKAWLVENGYPQEEIDKCGKHFWVRHWETQIDN
jgi:microsomal dipeptidase-like Zn-dependent dipeptidase